MDGWMAMVRAEDDRWWWWCCRMDKVTGWMVGVYV